MPHLRFIGPLSSWAGLVTVSADRFSTGNAAAPVRPDGNLGFGAGSADAAGRAAFDANLDSYLVPP